MSHEERVNVGHLSVHYVITPKVFQFVLRKTHRFFYGECSPFKALNYFIAVRDFTSDQASLCNVNARDGVSETTSLYG